MALSLSRHHELLQPARGLRRPTLLGEEEEQLVFIAIEVAGNIDRAAYVIAIGVVAILLTRLIVLVVYPFFGFDVLIASVILGLAMKLLRSLFSTQLNHRAAALP